MDYFTRTKIKDILENRVKDNSDVIILGWVRTKRLPSWRSMMVVHWKIYR